MARADVEISIATSFDYEIPMERQAALVAEAGFSHVSLASRQEHSGYASSKGREKLRTILKRQALAVDTIHGPRADRPDSLAGLTAAAEAAAGLSARCVVFHGAPFFVADEELPDRLDALLRTCEALRPVAERLGVSFALENTMPGAATELIRRALPQLDPRHFGFCYDSSHEQIGGPRPFDLLTERAGRVLAVHLSDRLREFIDHVIPGEGFIDWPALCDALRGTSFAGPVALEVMRTHSAEKDERRFLHTAFKRGRELHGRIFSERVPNVGQIQGR